MPAPEPEFDSRYDRLIEIPPTNNDLPQTLDEFVKPPAKKTGFAPGADLNQRLGKATKENSPDADSQLHPALGVRIEKSSQRSSESDTRIQTELNQTIHTAQPSPLTSQAQLDQSVRMSDWQREADLMSQPNLHRPIDTGNRDDYLDPSHHDLTGDSRDPEEELGAAQRRTLFCFHCHRPETHSLATRHSPIYSFLIGLSLGLVKLLGPFYCRCCGHRRLMASDRLHPKFWLHTRHLRKKTKRSRFNRIRR
jgi:hypothetical protein